MRLSYLIYIILWMCFGEVRLLFALFIIMRELTVISINVSLFSFLQSKEHYVYPPALRLLPLCYPEEVQMHTYWSLFLPIRKKIWIYLTLPSVMQIVHIFCVLLSHFRYVEIKRILSRPLFSHKANLHSRIMVPYRPPHLLHFWISLSLTYFLLTKGYY